MTWDEAVHFYSKSVSDTTIESCYFHENPLDAANAFLESDEFKYSLKLIKQHPNGVKLLDIGAGNGIASFAFVNSGYDVTALEPDTSNRVGRGAIQELNKNLKSKIQINGEFAEKLPFKDSSFDIVYCRQVVHHAHDLGQFMKEIARVLKPDGVVLTVRDHVISKEEDLSLFLDRHPLHKYYGGEHAFTESQYESAFSNANLSIVEKFLPLESHLNYYPESPITVSRRIRGLIKPKMNSILYHLTRFLSPKLVIRLFGKQASLEMNDPGRLYSYLMVKSK